MPQHHLIDSVIERPKPCIEILVPHCESTATISFVQTSTWILSFALQLPSTCAILSPQLRVLDSLHLLYCHRFRHRSAEPVPCVCAFPSIFSHQLLENGNELSSLLNCLERHVNFLIRPSRWNDKSRHCPCRNWQNVCFPVRPSQLICGPGCRMHLGCWFRPPTPMGCRCWSSSSSHVNEDDDASPNKHQHTNNCANDGSNRGAVRVR
mmetsp:Transcript_99485/g.191059  ORF Transcript_99485/g.191059 Transcript_99485/m.191059 type:complete len:208 (+) Transcript_99485:472-1095(+)